MSDNFKSLIAAALILVIAIFGINQLGKELTRSPFEEATKTCGVMGVDSQIVIANNYDGTWHLVMNHAFWVYDHDLQQLPITYRSDGCPEYNNVPNGFTILNDSGHIVEESQWVHIKIYDPIR